MNLPALLIAVSLFNSGNSSVQTANPVNPTISTISTNPIIPRIKNNVPLQLSIQPKLEKSKKHGPLNSSHGNNKR